MSHYSSSVRIFLVAMVFAATSVVHAQVSSGKVTAQPAEAQEKKNDVLSGTWKLKTIGLSSGALTDPNIKEELQGESLEINGETSGTMIMNISAGFEDKGLPTLHCMTTLTGPFKVKEIAGFRLLSYGPSKYTVARNCGRMTQATKIIPLQENLFVLGGDTVTFISPGEGNVVLRTFTRARQAAR